MNDFPEKILYFDMDNVLVDFKSGINKLSSEDFSRYKDKYDEVPGIFSKMNAIEGAVEAYQKLSSVYDSYILSTAPWENATAWSDKLNWVKDNLGDSARKRLILTHNKNIDDRSNNGTDKFKGEWIKYGSERFPDWTTILKYLLPQ